MTSKDLKSLSQLNAEMTQKALVVTIEGIHCSLCWEGGRIDGGLQNATTCLARGCPLFYWFVCLRLLYITVLQCLEDSPSKGAKEKKPILTQ